MNQNTNNSYPSLAGSQPWVFRFLNRPVKNFESFKHKPRYQYEEKFEAIGLKFSVKPFLHQLVCIYLAVKEKAFNLFLDVGLGKTCIALNVIYTFKLRKQKHRALVLVPSRVNIPTWEHEVILHRPELKFKEIEGECREDRLALINSDADVLCITYGGLLRLVCDLMPNPKKPGRMHNEISEDLIKTVFESFGIVILDELSYLRNPQSKIVRVCQYFLNYVPVRIGMTGTPVGRFVGDLWAEFFVIDGGESLGENNWLFEKVFFDIKKNFWGGVDKTFRKDLMVPLKRLMYNRAIHYAQEECERMLIPIRTPIGLPMPEKMKPYYTKIHERILASLHPGHDVQESRQTLWIQKRAVVSNFLKLRDSDTGNSVLIDIPSEVKLEALIDYASKIPDGHKMVIFHEFIHSGDKIEAAMKKAKLKALRIRHKTKDIGAVLTAFRRDPECQFLIISLAMGAAGPNLQAANYVGFYESPVRPDIRLQAEARVQRTGQTKQVFIVDFFIKDSVEEQVLEFVQEGRDLHAELMSNPQEVGKFL